MNFSNHTRIKTITILGNKQDILLTTPIYKPDYKEFQHLGPNIVLTLDDTPQTIVSKILACIAICKHKTRNNKNDIAIVQIITHGDDTYIIAEHNGRLNRISRDQLYDELLKMNTVLQFGQFLILDNSCLQGSKTAIYEDVPTTEMERLMTCRDKYIFETLEQKCKSLNWFGSVQSLRCEHNVHTDRNGIINFIDTTGVGKTFKLTNKKKGTTLMTASNAFMWGLVAMRKLVDLKGRMVKLRMTDFNYEVFLVYKEIGKNKSTPNTVWSHHLIILRDVQTNKYYQTDLQTENGDMSGIVCIRLLDAEELENDIYYTEIGYLAKTYDDILTYTSYHKMNGTEYNLLTNNCQHYCDKFFDDMGVVMHMSTVDSLISSTHIVKAKSIKSIKMTDSYKSSFQTSKQNVLEYRELGAPLCISCFCDNFVEILKIMDLKCYFRPSTTLPSNELREYFEKVAPGIGKVIQRTGKITVLGEFSIDTMVNDLSFTDICTVFIPLHYALENGLIAKRTAFSTYRYTCECGCLVPLCIGR